MPATFNRIKNWIAETLNYADLNAEIDNILTNLTPAGMDDYSANAAQMKLQTSPGAVGTESLAQSAAGEIERLRYVLARIIGSTYWYEAPVNSLASISASLDTVLSPNRIESGKMRTSSSQPIYLKPNGAALSASAQGATTNLLYYVNSTLVTISSNVTLSSIVGAPSSNNTCLVNEPYAAGGEDTKYLGEYGSSLIVDTMGSEISALVGKLAAFKINNGVTDEYFIARVKSSTELSEIRRGFFFDSADAPVPRIAISDNNTITLLKLGYVFGKSDGTLAITYDEPIYSAVEPTSPSSGQYWFDLVNDTWKRFDGATFVSATAIFIGWVASTSAATVAARSADFSRAHSDLNTVDLFKFDNTQVRAKDTEAQVSIYGATMKFGNYLPRWDIDEHLDSGLTEAADTLYFLYMNEDGKSIISTQAPMDRTGDLRGLYHPHHTWRCVGQVYNNASSNFEALLGYSEPNDMAMAVSHKVSGSALTLILHKNPIVPLKFKAETAAIGEQSEAPVLPMTSLVVSSGSTLGTTSAVLDLLVLHALRNSGRAELAISRCQFPSVGLISSTAEGGAGAADSGLTLYSKVARTSVPGIAIALLESTQATAGTWATSLSDVKIASETSPIRKRNTNVYSSSTTFVVPAGVNEVGYLECGGGGGGGGNPSGSSGGGGGGGGGEIAEGLMRVIPGETLTLTIGAGGAAGPAAASASGNGGSGGNSSIAGSLMTVTARGGGYGGGAATAQNGQSIKHYSGGTAATLGGGGGAGGHGPGGNGGAAGSPGSASGWSGGGGGSANTGAGGVGGDGGSSRFAAGGTGAPASANRSAGGGGGASIGAGGNGANGNTANFVSPGAGTNGGGGGGGGNATSTAQAGAAGGDGQITLFWSVA